MRLKTRMMIVVTSMCTCLGLVSTIFIGTNLWLKQKTDHVSALQNQALSLLDEASNANTNFLLQIKEFKNVLIRHQDATALEKHKAGYKKHNAEVQKHLDIAIKNSIDAKAKQQLSSIQEQHLILDKKYQEALTTLDPNNPTSFQDVDKSLNGIDKPVVTEFETLTNYIHNTTTKEVANQQAALAKLQPIAITGLIIFMLTSLGIMVGLLYWNNRKIYRQIGGEPDYVNQIAEEIANGKLNTHIKLLANDQHSILYGIRRMRNHLREIMGNLKSHTQTLDKNASELSIATEQLSSNINRQNDAATSMASAIEEMTVSINHVADSAKDASHATRESDMTAKEGAKTIAETSAKMEEIANAVIQAVNTINTLGKQTQTISHITNVIKEVADQTNLLALNAAIEAARAGEEGRGFAVVADEVRNLAGRTTQATSEISAMIINIQNEAQTAVTRMTQTNQLVNEGVSLASQAKSGIHQIQELVNTTSHTIQQISDALSEQSEVCETIAKTVEEVTQSSEENGNATHHSSQQAQTVANISVELFSLLTQFDTTDSQASETNH